MLLQKKTGSSRPRELCKYNYDRQAKGESEPSGSRLILTLEQTNNSFTNSSLFEALTQQPGTVHAIFELWPQHALPFTFCAFCVSHFQKYPLRVLNKYRAIHGKCINRIENQSLLESVILIKNFIYFWVVKRQKIIKICLLCMALLWYFM